MDFKVEYDADADALYFAFKRGEVRRTVAVGDRVTVDLDYQGNLLGIEVLRASGDE